MLNSHLSENRFFEPPSHFTQRSLINKDLYGALYQQAALSPETFWANEAKNLVWKKNFSLIKEGNFPFPRWFSDGLLNATDTCLKQHAFSDLKDKIALLWEGELGSVRKITYGELYESVCRFAQKLNDIGIQKGDRVAIYMPLIPEAVVSMLACAHLGAIHTVIFGGFSTHSVGDRIKDASCKAVITADGGYRKGQIIPLEKTVKEALAQNACPSIETVLVWQYLESQQVAFSTTAHLELYGWRPSAPQESFCVMSNLPSNEENLPFREATAVEANHPLFILYTSGTTGKPKGLVHGTGGYLTQAVSTCKAVFDLQKEDIYWCTADVGWITGHSYVVYGPLANGATVFLYEGAPLYPQPNRFWEMIERHRITILYTAPTAIRTFMRCGDEHIQAHDLSSLRLLGSVGEPINPEAWMWYHTTVGGGHCPIVDTWWQTETGAIMISPLPGATTTYPGSATQPYPGISANIVHPDGTPCSHDEGGYLVIEKPWPSLALGIWGDNERFIQTYFSQHPHAYFTGDGARRDSQGNFWLLGRIDDVVNVSGHRLGTAEIESALVAYKGVAEAAVVARPDELTGQAIVAFVTLKESVSPSAELQTSLFKQVAQEIGAFARPSEIRFAKALPKTRSGKIMRRLLKELASTGEIKGDITTLEDYTVIQALQEGND